MKTLTVMLVGALTVLLQGGCDPVTRFEGVMVESDEPGVQTIRRLEDLEPVLKSPRVTEARLYPGFQPGREGRVIPFGGLEKDPEGRYFARPDPKGWFRFDVRFLPGWSDRIYVFAEGIGHEPLRGAAVLESDHWPILVIRMRKSQ